MPVVGKSLTRRKDRKLFWIGACLWGTEPDPAQRSYAVLDWDMPVVGRGMKISSCGQQFFQQR